jgi:calcium homeostasis ER protein
MGWEEGAGLGLREQGIQEPIKGGEIRDKNDKYKGVGMDMKDPFELFRKNKSYTFNRPRAPPASP